MSTKKITINKDFLISVIFLIILSGILELYYSLFLVNVYESEGYILSFNLLKYIESKLWFIILIFISYILNLRSQFISSLYIFLLLIIFIPEQIFYAYSDASRLVFYSIISFFLILSLFSTLKFKVRTVFMPDRVKYYILIVFSLLLVLPIFMDFKLNINPKVFALQEIYDVRAVYKTQMSFFSSYTFWWMAKVVVPVMFVYSLIRKNYKFAIFSIVILMYLFLVSGHKSVYFTPIVILFYYFIGKDYNKKIKLSLIYLSIFLILINIPDLLMDRYLFKSLFVRRVFFVSTLLNEFYFEYFQHNSVYLSHSIFSNFLSYPYDVTPAYIIGEEYFGRPEMSANNGIISDGFMNFGYVGVVVFSTIFSLILSLFNSIKINPKYFGIFIFYILIFRGSAFLTVFLTHGFWLVILFAFIIFPKKDNILKK